MLLIVSFVSVIVTICYYLLLFVTICYYVNLCNWYLFRTEGVVSWFQVPQLWHVLGETVADSSLVALRCGASEILTPCISAVFQRSVDKIIIYSNYCILYNIYIYIIYIYIIYIYTLYIYTLYIYIIYIHYILVVPHKAVAEVSKIGNI